MQNSRDQLERGYRATLPKVDSTQELLCFHLNRLADWWGALSALVILRRGPTMAADLQESTLFICVDIGVTCIDELFNEKLVDGVTALRIRDVWAEYSRLHRIVKYLPHNVPLANTIHLLFLSAIGMCVATICHTAAIEPEWIQIAKDILPGALFDGTANDELRRMMLERLRSELEDLR